MRRAIKAPTKAEREYQDRARALGCVVCRFRIANGMQAAGQAGGTEIHHRNIGDYHGQKQIGQHAVVALCEWHHDGDWVHFGWSDDEMREVYGPSFKHAADFREWTYDVLPGMGRGTEAWQRYQDLILEDSE